MKNNLLIYLHIIFIASCSLVYAESEFKNNISMECPEYEAHHKSIVDFPHLKHTKAYNISCGECHHEENGEPIDDLVIGDEVIKCIECHYNPSYVTGKSYGEQLEYHTNTLHFQCKNCHRLENAKKLFTSSSRGKKAPVNCNQCH